MAGGMSTDCATPERATGSVIHRTVVWPGVGALGVAVALEFGDRPIDRTVAIELLPP